MAWEIDISQQPEKIGIATPHMGEVSAGYAAGLKACQIPFDILMIMQKNAPLDLARNMCVSQALKNSCTRIFFVDSDIELGVDTFIKLFNTDMPIISATYFERAPPYKVVARMNGVPLEPDLIKRYNTPVQAILEVHEVGLGAILIDIRIFARLGAKINKWTCLVDHTKEINKMVVNYTHAQAVAQNYECSICHNLLVCPFFQHRNGFFDDLPVSEDYMWSASVRNLGFQIFISPDAVVWHHSTAGDYKTGMDGPVTTMSHLGLAGAKI